MASYFILYNAKPSSYECILELGTFCSGGGRIRITSSPCSLVSDFGLVLEHRMRNQTGCIYVWHWSMLYNYGKLFSEKSLVHRGSAAFYACCFVALFALSYFFPFFLFPLFSFFSLLPFFFIFLLLPSNLCYFCEMVKKKKSRCCCRFPHAFASSHPPR